MKLTIPDCILCANLLNENWQKYEQFGVISIAKHRYELRNKFLEELSKLEKGEEND